jgi:hypothetical protein
MLNRFCGRANRVAEPGGEDPALGAVNTTVPADFKLLSGDEIERLIGLCEAPALLWRDDPPPAREPEPFGMIA